jgi:hypothetical protein
MGQISDGAFKPKHSTVQVVPVIVHIFHPEPEGHAFMHRWAAVGIFQ